MLPADAGDRPPPPARGVPVRRPGAQGRWGRKRRHARLDRALPRRRRSGPALPAGQGSPARRCWSSSSARANTRNCGQRVVAGQRLMQATSDIFLGWQHITSSLDGQERDFYVRQLKDWKGSFAFEAALPVGAAAYGKVCGRTLARAHARSGDRIAIASYLGKSNVLRPGHRHLRRSLRRPERTRLQRAQTGRRVRPNYRAERAVGVRAGHARGVTGAVS